MPAAVSRQEQGNITLYAVILIPLAISLAVLAVDVSSYQILRNTAQKEADRIALQAAEFLPDTDAAQRLVLESVSKLPALDFQRKEDLSPVLEVSSSRVSFSLQGSVPAALDIFMRKSDGTGHVFTVSESSRAQIVPRDYVLIIADALSLRPPAGENWGDESLWPASGYFNYARPPVMSSTTPFGGGGWLEWWKAWDSVAYRRWITQSCYNPLYSGLKYAAISLIDALGAVDTNRISLIFTPENGSAQGCSVSRPLGFMSAASGEAQARWLAYFEPESFVADEACVYFADPALSSDPRYMLTQAPSFISLAAGVQDCTTRYNQLLQGQGYFLPSGTLSDCFVSQALTLREAVYYHAARNVAHRPQGENIAQAIDQDYLQLMVASEEETSQAAVRRGNLAYRASRKIVVLTDYLPSEDLPGFSDILARLEQAQISLVLVPFMPQEALSGMGNLKERTDLLRARTSALMEQKRNYLQILPAFSAEDMENQVIPAIVALGREFAIRS